MTAPYYDSSGSPATSSFGTSSTIRNEFAAVETSFDLFPAFSGNAGKLLQINSGESAVEASSAIAVTTLALTHTTASALALIRSGQAYNIHLDGAGSLLVYDTTNTKTLAAFLVTGFASLYGEDAAQLTTFDGGVSVNQQVRLDGATGEDSVVNFRENNVGMARIFYDADTTIFKIRTAVVGGQIRIEEGNANKVMAEFDADAGVKLRFDDVVKLDVVTDGVEITGKCDFTHDSINDTNDHTFTSNDRSRIRRYTGTGGHTWTMPTGVGSDGDYIPIMNSGTATLAIAGSGVTISSLSSLLSVPINGFAKLWRISDTNWMLEGDLV